MNAEPIRTYAEGATLPLLTISTRLADGTPQQLIGYTMRLRMARDSGPALEKTAIISNAETGEAYFSWQPEDLKAGHHLAQITLTDPSGGELVSKDLLFEVRRRV
jgi:hypothetical protein